MKNYTHVIYGLQETKYKDPYEPIRLQRNVMSGSNWVPAIHPQFRQRRRARVERPRGEPELRTAKVKIDENRAKISHTSFRTHSQLSIFVLQKKTTTGFL